MHRLRSAFDFDNEQLTLQVVGDSRVHEFHVERQRPQLNAWLSDYFGVALELVENDAAGFPDDTESPGPTVISSATLATVAGWFNGLTAADVQRPVSRESGNRRRRAILGRSTVRRTGSGRAVSHRRSGATGHQSLPTLHRSHPGSFDGRDGSAVRQASCPATPGDAASLGERVAIRSLLPSGRQHSTGHVAQCTLASVTRCGSCPWNELSVSLASRDLGNGLPPAAGRVTQHLIQGPILSNSRSSPHSLAMQSF